MTERRRLTKEERRAVYDKTHGHCAYCGCNIGFEDMQVDHVVPLGGLFKGQILLIICYLPAVAAIIISLVAPSKGSAGS